MRFFDAQRRYRLIKAFSQLTALLKRSYPPLLKTAVVLLLPTALSTLLCSKANAQFLKVSGRQITNGQTPHFIIRGIGLGGYMLQEGYMFHLGFLGTQTRIQRKIQDMVGAASTRQFYKDWHHQFIQKADIDSIAAWGFNAVRLPMHYKLFTLPTQLEPTPGHNTWLSTGFNLVDSLLSWCSQAHIYLILDLHAAPGGQGHDLPISDRDPELPSLWQSKANQDKTVALWEKLAMRYKDAPYIGGYDLLNETNWGFTDSTDLSGTREQDNQPLWHLLRTITAAIRTHDKRHMVILEGNGFANNYSGLDSLWDNNTVISFHKYGNFNNQKSIQYFLNLREKLQAPIWLGESGENSNNWYTHCTGLMEHYQIGWSWWPWKKMGLNNPLEIKQPKHYEEFIRYCRSKGPKPDRVTGNKILHGLIQNIQISQNIIHKDVIHALFQSLHDPAAIPFATYVVGKRPCYILAADYDLGGNGVGYLDKDTASYQYTPGVHTDGNKGHQYRNDGVDIRMDSTSGKPFIFSIEKGEWLSYSLDITDPGAYELQLDYAKQHAPIMADTTGKLAIDIFQGSTQIGHLDLGPGPGNAPASGSRKNNLFIISKPAIIHLSTGSKAGPIKLKFNHSGLLLRGIIIKATAP